MFQFIVNSINLTLEVATVEIDYRVLARRLAYYRKTRGLTQARLAEQAGLTNNYISNIETCHSIPSLETLVRLCQVLEITPNDLLLESAQHSEAYLASDIAARLAALTPRDKRLVDGFIALLLAEHEK